MVSCRAWSIECKRISPFVTKTEMVKVNTKNNRSARKLIISCDLPFAPAPSNVYVHGDTNGRVGARTIGWMDGWMDGPLVRAVDAGWMEWFDCMGEKTDNLICGWMDLLIHGWMDGWMDASVDA